MYNFTKQIQEKYAGETIEKGPNYNPDPTGIRIGNPPEGKLSETLERVAKELEEYVDKVREDSMQRKRKGKVCLDCIRTTFGTLVILKKKLYQCVL